MNGFSTILANKQFFYLNRIIFQELDFRTFVRCRRVNKQWKKFLHDDPMLWRQSFRALLYLNDLGILPQSSGVETGVRKECLPKLAWKKWYLLENQKELPNICMIMLRLDIKCHPIAIGFWFTSFMNMYSNIGALKNNWSSVSKLDPPHQSLHFCILLDFVETLDFLLENLCSLPIYLESFHDGCTPLHLACKYGKFNMVKTLVPYYSSMPMDLNGCGADVIALSNNHNGISLFVSMHFACK